MNYKIRTIPHSSQRYETVGDYWYKHQQELELRVSDMSQAVPRAEPLRLDAQEVSLAEKYEFLITIHEMVESFLCHQASIDFEKIDEYDMSSTSNDPGAEPEAPYHLQHIQAELVEKYVAQILAVDWDTYSKAVDSLFKSREQETQAS